MNSEARIYRSSTPPYYRQHGLLQTATCTAARGRFVSTDFICYCSSPSFVPLMASRPDGLALNGNAPRIFLKVTSNGLPWVSVAFSAVFGLLAFMGISSGSGKVFAWFVNM